MKTITKLAKPRLPLISWLQRMHESRRVLLPPMGERSKPAMLISIALSILLMSLLLSLAWVQKSDIDYLRGSSGVVMLDDLKWNLTLPHTLAKTVSLDDLGSTSVTELKGQPFQLSVEFDAATIKNFMIAAGESPVILSLPPIEFDRLELSSSWLSSRVLLRSEEPTLTFDSKLTAAAKSFTLTLTVWPHNTQERIVRSSVNIVPTFLAVQARYQKYQDFLAGRRTGSGKQLADIGRIVLAVFAVFLFIFIDSSPECLALGIFMSLKALAVAVGQGWLPDSLFSAASMTSARYFLLSFADFMQLYFFTQMARIYQPKPILWLACGIVFGSIYMSVSNIVPDPGGLNWGFQAWKWRNLLIGIACLTCSVPVAIVCWRARLYHRTTALMVASSGVLVQIITPLIVGIPGVTESLWYKTWYNLFEAHTPYMFALSTFINVSTLERRVKTLSRAAIRKDAIERELTLGKAVQDAFFRVPELPPGINMTYAHEAAEYVSGDILFSHWDKQHDTIALVLCDVTGHGVQAALKASICSAMCASIWEHGQLRPSDKPGMRLQILQRRVTTYLTKTSGNPEILAMLGCEVDLKSRMLWLYRSNAVYPLIIGKKAGQWVVQPKAKVNDHLDSISADDVAFVILFSDGIIDGARTMLHLVRYIEATLAPIVEINSAQVKNIIFNFDRFVETHDDKTLAVLDVQEIARAATKAA